MAFRADLTEVLGARVLEADGRLVGRLADLAADPDAPHPTVTGLVVRRRWARTLVPAEAVAEWGTREIHLLRGAAPGRVPGAAALLRRDVLDTQIVDFRERRVTRVSDVMLESRDGRLEVVGVDVGAGAVARRLGLRRPARWLGERRIAWTELHPLHDRARSLMVSAPSHPPPHRRPVRYVRLGRRLRART